MLSGTEIRDLRKKKGYSQQKLADLVGVSRTAVASWENDTYRPDGRNAVPLARALDINPSEFLPGANENDFSRQSDNNDMPHGEPPVWIDVVEPVVCAGNGNGYVEVDWEPVGRYPFSAADLIGYSWHSGKLRIIRIEGSSMEPRYSDGDRIMFSEEEVSSGDVAIVLWDSKLLIRGYVVERDNTVHLRALNRENPEIVVYPEDERFQVLGKVLGRVSRFEPDKGFW